jgi:hypothetical protein
MALVLADRVRETTTTTGTGSVTLAGAYTGFQTFSAGVGTGNSTYYTIANVGSGEWEVGIGSYTSGGNTLSRTTVLASSNSGSLVNFGAGSKDVFVTQPAERALYVASAGTGLESKVTAFTNGGIVYASSTSALATGSALVFDGTNLGVGVTPSAWGSFTGMQIGALGGLSLGGTTDNIFLGSNVYFGSGAFKYAATGYVASNYRQTGGYHYWFTTGTTTGTAGATASFTQAMTLDASGNLGVGYTTINTTIAVNGNALFGTGAWPTSDFGRSGSRFVNASSTEDGYLAVLNMQSGVAANRGGYIYLGARRTTGVDGSTFATIGGIRENATSGDYATALTFNTSTSAGALTERARINSSGQFLLNSSASFECAYSGNGLVLSKTNVGAKNAIVSIADTSSVLLINNSAAGWDNVAIYTAGTEAARIDSSGNLGVGTTSPVLTLDVERTTTTVFSGTGYRVARFHCPAAVNADKPGIILGYDSAGAGIIAADTQATGQPIAFWTYNGSAWGERARIDSSGNLGLGVTPTSTQSGYKAIQIGATTGGGIVSAGTDTYFTNNAYVTGSQWYSGSTGYASYYNQSAGAHTWTISTTAGAAGAKTMSTQMTLNASGKLLLGCTSDNGGLTQLQIAGSNTAGSSQSITFRLTDNGAYAGFRLSATGNFCTDIYTGSAWAEATRIDASGNLLVGKTAASLGANGFEGSANGTVSSTLSASTSATSTYNAYSSGVGAFRFYVDMGGTVHATSIVITAISDQRLKENVRDIDTGLDSIMALKPRRFDWKEGKGQDKKDVAGFIAQEFEDVFPECVGVSKAGADGIEYKNINHETLIPTLVKAIQEQQALITQLTVRITALEGA